MHQLSNLDILKQARRKLDPIFEKLKGIEFSIGGGYAANAIHEIIHAKKFSHDSDIDLYFFGDFDSMKSAYRILVGDISDNIELTAKCVVKVESCGTKYDLILLPKSKSKSDVLKDYDLALCSFIFSRKDVYYNARAINDIRNHVITPVITEDIEAFFLRYAKYAARGFSMLPAYMKVIITDFGIDCIDHYLKGYHGQNIPAIEKDLSVNSVKNMMSIRSNKDYTTMFHCGEYKEGKKDFIGRDIVILKDYVE